ncbi:MAG: carbohydrate ABC transporter permease [Actinobacteria bacterium]|nr:carbohydrate ABC transporter permease [Actinomycetota bacterium]
MRRIRIKGDVIFKQIIMVITTILALYPVIWLISIAFKDKNQYLENKFFFSWPLQMVSFDSALRGGRFFLWFMNSAIMTVGSVILCTIIAVFAAYAFAKMRFKGQDLLMNILIALMVIPVVVLIVPLFILYTQTKLMATYPGMIIIYAAVCMPFSVYLLTNFFKTIPHEIIEAGIVDGCSSFTILTKVVMPLSGPPVTTLIVVNALWIWNELLLALVFLPKDNLRTLIVGITVFKSKYNLEVPTTMAGLLLTTIPMVVLYIVFQKFFIRGLTAGSIK